MVVTAGTDGDNVGFLPSDDDLLKLKAGDHDSLFSFFLSFLFCLKTVSVD